METTVSKEKIENSAKATEGNGQKFAEGFAKDVKAYSRDAVETISSGYDTALAWAKKNPIQAAAIGAGVGFVVGALIRKVLADRK
jgi:ElaB/YqjD/DUF883 family membrane-anchored ribosome-binding protein